MKSVLLNKQVECTTTVNILQRIPQYTTFCPVFAAFFARKLLITSNVSKTTEIARTMKMFSYFDHKIS